MNESKIFCSVIIFTFGIYTIFLLQYELFKLNNLNTYSSSDLSAVTNNARSKSAGGGGGGGPIRSKKFENGTIEKQCNVTVAKRKFTVDRLNCGSASELLSVAVQNCQELPCDIKPNTSYTVVLTFIPSRNISSLEIETFVRQRKELKYLHKERVSTQAVVDTMTTLKFSFAFPPHPIFQPTKRLKSRKCPTAVQLLYLLGVEIWDVSSGIGEICLIVPMLISFA